MREEMDSKLRYPRDAIKRVGVLGATGTVGQRFIILLSKHPNFELYRIGASTRSAGKRYDEIVRWKQTLPIPSAVREMMIYECEPQHFIGCDIIFSGLDADVAGQIESDFRSHDLAVFSNAKNHRTDPICPLVVPLVNPSHLEMIPYQRSQHLDPLTGSSKPLTRGFIVTNANCSTTGLVIPLKALEDRFGPINKVIVTTLQAISGGGYPGVASLDILDNVVPYIPGEEEKIENETQKILGSFDRSRSTIYHRSPNQPLGSHPSSNVEFTPIIVSATTTRVPVLDGHTATVSVSFKNQPGPSVQDCISAFQDYQTLAQTLDCPSAPHHPISYHHQPDRPQPRLDRYFEDGAGVSVGRVRECSVLDIKFIVLSNNVSIGAATSSVMNAELVLAKGLI